MSQQIGSLYIKENMEDINEIPFMFVVKRDIQGTQSEALYSFKVLILQYIEDNLNTLRLYKPSIFNKLDGNYLSYLCKVNIGLDSRFELGNVAIV